MLLHAVLREVNLSYYCLSWYLFCSLRWYCLPRYIVVDILHVIFLLDYCFSSWNHKFLTQQLSTSSGVELVVMMIGLMHRHHLSGRYFREGATFFVDHTITSLSLWVRNSALLKIRRSEMKLSLTLFLRRVIAVQNHIHSHILLSIIWMVVILLLGAIGLMVHHLGGWLSIILLD